MSRPKNMNEMSREGIEKNFLSESPEIPTEQKVVVAQEIPAYEEVIFHNMRDEGVTLHFHYKSKTHPLKHYNLVHGLKYRLPVEVIKHLQGDNSWDPYACHSRIYAQRKNSEGLPENYVCGYKPYFQLKTVRA